MPSERLRHSLAKRIIACLDVDAGRVVKGVQFQQLRDAGDPAELALAHASAGADEIVLLDITATAEGRKTLVETVRRAAKGSVCTIHRRRRHSNSGGCRQSLRRRSRQGHHQLCGARQILH